MNKKKVLVLVIISLILILTCILISKNKEKEILKTESLKTDNLIENEITQDESEKNKESIISNEHMRKEELIRKYESKLDRKKVNEVTEKINKNPNNAKLYFERAELYRLLDELEKAYSDYTEAINIDKNKPKYYIKRAWTYRESEISKAEDDILKAKQILKTDDDKILIENYYLYRKNYEKALEELEQLSKKNKNYYDEILFIFSDMGNKEKTMEFSDIYIKKYPKSINGYLYKGGIYNNNEEYEKALEIYLQALKITNKGVNDKAILYNRMGKVYYFLEKYKEANNCIDKAIALKPENDELALAYMTKGDINNTLDNNEEAIKNYRKAIEIDLIDDENLDYRERSLICYGYLIDLYTAVGEREKAYESENMKKEIEEYRQNLLEGRE